VPVLDATIDVLLFAEVSLSRFELTLASNS
jgi:hypothetical protein